MPELLILSKQADTYRSLLEAAQLPDLHILDGAQAGNFALAEIVFGEPDLIRAHLPDLRGLKWAQSTWAGVEPLLDASLRRDYVLSNARGVFGGLMSEFVLAYLLLHERKVLQRFAAQQEARWDATLTGTLRGKTIGLLGVGSIGAELARTARFFEMKVRGHTRASQDCEYVDEYFQAGQLPDFASGLDYLVSSLPATPETRRVVDAALLARLPAHALFINVGRGSAVDEVALIAALQSGALAGAVLDVFEQEPLPPAHPFWTTPNLMITSHTSAPSFPVQIARLFVENYLRYAEGQPVKYRVDFERGY